MAFDLGKNAHLIAFNVQGDIGPTTLYTSVRGKKVSFLRAPPKEPPSPQQEIIRDQFRNAALTWWTLTPAQRRDYATAAQRCNLGVTGYDIWTWFYCLRREDQLRTIERNSGLSLTRP